MICCRDLTLMPLLLLALLMCHSANCSCRSKSENSLVKSIQARTSVWKLLTPFNYRKSTGQMTNQIDETRNQNTLHNLGSLTELSISYKYFLSLGQATGSKASDGKKKKPSNNETLNIKYTVKDMRRISGHDRNRNIMYSLIILTVLPCWGNPKQARSQNHSRRLGQGRTRTISWFWTLRSGVIFVHLSSLCKGPLCWYERRYTWTPLMSNHHGGIAGSHFSEHAYVKKVWVQLPCYQFDLDVPGLSCLSSYFFLL